MGLEVCRKLSVPACLLFNESPQFDSVLEAVDLGFNLVMFSDEKLDAGGNEPSREEVCAKAHPAGAAVEAEMAVLHGIGRADDRAAGRSPVDRSSRRPDDSSQKRASTRWR